MIQFKNFDSALQSMIGFLEMEEAGDSAVLDDPVYHAAVHHVFTHMHTEAPELARMFDEGFRLFFPELADSEIINEQGHKCFTVSEVAAALAMSEQEITEQLVELGAKHVNLDDLHKLQ